jgi:hypothetical protein
MGGNVINNIGSPTQPEDAANKAYVDEHNYLQITTDTYSTCTNKDKYCDLPIKITSGGPDVTNPSWATKMYVKCYYGCHYTDKTSTWKVFLGNTELTSLSGYCYTWANPAAPHTIDCPDLSTCRPLALSSINVFDQEFDIAAIPAGSVLRAQAKSDMNNRVGHCTIIFSSD